VADEELLRCASCEAILPPEWLEEPDTARSPCPTLGCGSTERLRAKDLLATSKSRATLAAKLKRGGKGKPAVELKQGDDFHHQTATWRHRAQRLDRESDRWDKVVTDPETGQILYENHEPLSDHQDRGTARPK
jgi:hypothetical protein